MKTTVDALRDVGHTVIELQLVLNLLRGLNSHFSSTDEATTTPRIPIRCQTLPLPVKSLSSRSFALPTSNEGQDARSPPRPPSSPALLLRLHLPCVQGQSLPLGDQSGNTGSSQGTCPDNGDSYRNQQKGHGGGGGSSQSGSRSPSQPAGP